MSQAAVSSNELLPTVENKCYVFIIGKHYAHDVYLDNVAHPGNFVDAVREKFGLKVRDASNLVFNVVSSLPNKHTALGLFDSPLREVVNSRSLPKRGEFVVGKYSEAAISSGVATVQLATEPISTVPVDLATNNILIQLMKEMNSKLDRRNSGSSTDSSVTTAHEYEEEARASLPDLLVNHCGLKVVDGIPTHRKYGDIVGGLEGERPDYSVEWDFRAPVRLVGPAPRFPFKSKDFIIYPDREMYVRPVLINPDSRRLTPLKNGEEYPAACHYMAIIEITASENWIESDMFIRLEKQLAISLDRAKHENPDQPNMRIEDVVAVIGVVAPIHRKDIICLKVKTPLLKSLMDRGRFVFFRKAYIAPLGHPSPANHAHGQTQRITPPLTRGSLEEDLNMTPHNT